MNPNSQPQNVYPAPPPIPTVPVQDITPIVQGKKKFPKKLLIFLILLVVAGVSLFAFYKTENPVSEEENTQEVVHVFEEYPNFPGIPIKENTISFLKADGKFCLLYKGIVYLPQDSDSFIPKAMDLTEEMKAYPWIGLVDAPDNLVAEGGPGDAIFSFKETPSNRSFVFIVRWDTSEGENYHVFRFNNNNFSELRVFNTQKDGLYYAPKLHSFSPGGNYLNLNMFRCPGCLNDVPETLLYYIPTGDDRDLGQVSYFKWREDDNTYEYKDYEEGVDPANLPLRVNEFFEDSIDLLGP